MLVIWIIKMMFLVFLGIPIFYGLRMFVHRLGHINGLGSTEHSTLKPYYPEEDFPYKTPLDFGTKFDVDSKISLRGVFETGMIICAHRTIPYKPK